MLNLRIYAHSGLEDVHDAYAMGWLPSSIMWTKHAPKPYADASQNSLTGLLTS